MILNANIVEKSFGPKNLMTDVKINVDDGEKVGLIGRNGVGKSTLFGILAGVDSDYIGEIIFRKGTIAASTLQEHHGQFERTVMEYILSGLPEYSHLKNIIDNYPLTMGDDIKKIEEYTQALDRFGQKGFYQIEELVIEELKKFQLFDIESRTIGSLSGGQKRLVEIVKVMHADADLALIDEPTNHMDYIAKQQFIDWMQNAREAMLVITHDRDVLKNVDRIIEFKDGKTISYKGNYDTYLKQNAFLTGNAMMEYENIERQISNLKEKVLQFRRYKEKARDPDTIKQFKRRELQAQAELEKIEAIKKPTFWIDRDNVSQLDYRVANRYDKYKAKNISLNMRDGSMRSQRKLVDVCNLALGYGDNLLFENINIDLREGEVIEIRGRNGAGKSTIIKTLLNHADNKYSHDITIFDGDVYVDSHINIGVYEQEIDKNYLPLSLAEAIEKIYLEKGLTINYTKIRQLMGDYLFADEDADIIVDKLSGGQRARLQIISMLANNPQLLILDEPTNHLDLPSIEELENALERYSGAILYVSHDNYFREKIGGKIVQI